MDLIIDRAKWLRGTAAVRGSYLLRKEDGKMCCLGFLALACGYTKEEIRGKSSPSDLVSVGTIDNLPTQLAPLVFVKDESGFRRVAATEVGSELMSRNDHYHYEEEDGFIGGVLDNTPEENAALEAYVAETFRDKLGVNVTFIN